jgi:L-histidine Nalpha-methyltransferase
MDNNNAQTLPYETGVELGSGGLPPFERASMTTRLQDILDETDFGWLLGLIGEDQAGKLATLTADLRRDPSTTGDGKRIASGFSYLGASAIAWANACRDYLYPVMKESIESFDRRWSSIQPQLNRPYHYVSLGPGDGRKDAMILHDLKLANPEVCYVAVDMSAEMLRLGVQDVIRQIKLSRSRILPVQLDFSNAANIVALRQLLRNLFGPEPVLFSLLGNTMANFQHDTEVLTMLARSLLRPQDRFLVEVATTEGLDETLVQQACEEYGRSRTFREFTTSTLMHYTDLHIDMDSVTLHGSIEDDRSILVKILYQNRTGQDIRMTLPDRTTGVLARDDTIRLLLTRKYAPGAFDAVLQDSGIDMISSTHIDFSSVPGPHFGMALHLLGADRDFTWRPRSVADNIWQKE